MQKQINFKNVKVRSMLQAAEVLKAQCLWNESIKIIIKKIDSTNALGAKLKRIKCAQAMAGRGWCSW